MVVPGLVLNDSIKPIVQKIAKEPPIMINPDQLGGSLAAGKTFTMGIRSKTTNHVSSQCGKYFEYMSFSKVCTVFFIHVSFFVVAEILFANP